MKRYPSFESLPSYARYVGSDDNGPGSMSESMTDVLDSVPCDRAIVYIVDEFGFRSFFAI